MAEYPNTAFTDGQVWTADLATQAFSHPVFDGNTSLLGHRIKIQDTELDDASTSIKGRLNTITNGLLVTVSSGLTLTYAAGIVRQTNGLVLSIASGTIVAPDNSTSLIWIDNNGTVSVGTIAPSIRTLLAQVVTVSGVVTTLTDLRQIQVRNVAPVAGAIKVFGGTSTTDRTCANGDTLNSGIYYYRNFSVPVGVSITVSKGAFIYCSGNVQIDGTVNVTTASAGATGFATVATTASQGGLSGGGIGGGSGSLGTSQTAYPYKLQPSGSGGGIGFGSGTLGSGFQFANGGAGGGKLLCS